MLKTGEYYDSLQVVKKGNAAAERKENGPLGGTRKLRPLRVRREIDKSEFVGELKIRSSFPLRGRGTACGG